MPITLVADIFVLGLLPSAALVVFYEAYRGASAVTRPLPSCRALFRTAGWLSPMVGLGVVYLCGVLTYAITEIGPAGQLPAVLLGCEEPRVPDGFAMSLRVHQLGSKQLSDAVFHTSRLANVLKGTGYGLWFLGMACATWVPVVTERTARSRWRPWVPLGLLLLCPVLVCVVHYVAAAPPPGSGELGPRPAAAPADSVAHAGMTSALPLAARQCLRICSAVAGLVLLGVTATLVCLSTCGRRSRGWCLVALLATMAAFSALVFERFTANHRERICTAEGVVEKARSN